LPKFLVPHRNLYARLGHGPANACVAKGVRIEKVNGVLPDGPCPWQSRTKIEGSDGKAADEIDEWVYGRLVIGDEGESFSSVHGLPPGQKHTLPMRREGL
jgi:hypothetical protein